MDSVFLDCIYCLNSLSYVERTTLVFCQLFQTKLDFTACMKVYILMFSVPTCLGRYLRVYSNENDLNIFTESRVAEPVL